MVEHDMLQTASWFQHDKCIQLSLNFWKTWSCHLVLVWESIFSIEPRSFWKTVHGKSEGGKDLSSKSLDNHSTNLVIAGEKRWTSGKRQHLDLVVFATNEPEVSYPPKKCLGSWNRNHLSKHIYHKQPRSLYWLLVMLDAKPAKH